MQTTSDNINYDTMIGRSHCHTKTAVAWPAIIAGAVTAAVISLALLFLSSALGLASISPWSFEGVSATGFTVLTAICFIVMQAVASAFGGYLTGRLRSKWKTMHSDEVFFRDTAHGFLSWALATLLTAALLTSAISMILGKGINTASSIAAGAAAGREHGPKDMDMGFKGENDYFIDTLYRSEDVNLSSRDARAETIHILAKGVKEGKISEADKEYLSEVIADRTGLTEAEASDRLNRTIADMKKAKKEVKQKLDKARKVAATTSLYIFLSLIISAFIASAAAALGGRHRDEDFNKITTSY